MTTQTRKRRIWTSRHMNLTVPIWKATYKFTPRGDRYMDSPGYLACFGVPGPVMQIENPLTGQLDVIESFRGGVYDLDVEAAEKGWDEETAGEVERVLDKLALDRPALLQRVEYMLPPAEKPWPTYDEMADNKVIAEMARTLGLVGKTLAYEYENRQRPGLIQALESALEESPDPEPEPAPSVAVKPAAKAKKDPNEPEIEPVAVF